MNSIELPAQLLLAAAQFASTDAAKPNICVVSITNNGEGVTLRSTDGHRAFRCHIPASLCEIDGDLTTLEISAAQLRKSAARASVAIIAEAATTLLSHKRETLEIRPTNIETVTFPNLDQVWPDSFSYDSGRPIGFNSGYLKSVCSICEKLATNGNLALSFNAATCATQITAEADIYRSQDCGKVTLEFLVMPVQMRALDEQVRSRLESIASMFNRRPANTEGLKARYSSDGLMFERDGRPVFVARTISQAQTASLYIKGAA